MDQQPPAQGQPQIIVAPNTLTEQNLNQLLPRSGTFQRLKEIHLP